MPSLLRPGKRKQATPAQIALAWLMAQKRWHPNPNVRDLENDYPINTKDSDVNPLMYNAVGGSTIGYAGNYWRFNPSDFRMRTLDGVGVDWSISCLIS